MILTDVRHFGKEPASVQNARTTSLAPTCPALHWAQEVDLAEANRISVEGLLGPLQASFD
jgi:hypothetical protein